MSGVLIVAGVADADFAEEVRKTTRGLDIEIACSLPAGEQRTVLLVWSAAQPATAADVPTLIDLWSRGRLVIARRDDTPLLLGLGDLETVPAGAPARETAFKLLHATLAPADTAEAAMPPPAAALEAPAPEPVAAARPMRRWPMAVAASVLVLLVAGALASWMQQEALPPAPKSVGAEEAAMRRDLEAAKRLQDSVSRREQPSSEERDRRVAAERAAREQPRPTAVAPSPPPASARPSDDARIADLERQIAALSRERAAPPAEGPSWLVWAAGAGGAAVMALLLLLFQRRRRPAVIGIAAVPVAKPVPEAAAAMPPEVTGESLFVSYAHHDRLRVDPLVLEIEGLGRAVWIDRTGMTGGPGWAGQIARAIKGSRAVVLMASPSAYASDQVVRELYLAMGSRKIIVPIELEPADLPDELAYILAPFQRHALAGDPRTMLMRALDKV